MAKPVGRRAAQRGGADRIGSVKRVSGATEHFPDDQVDLYQFHLWSAHWHAGISRSVDTNILRKHRSVNNGTGR